MTTSVFRLAHLSDPHLSVPHPPKLRLSQHGLKRWLAYGAWYRGRRLRHPRAILDETINDLIAFQPDHVAITGDLTQLGQPGELAEAERWLRGLPLPPDAVSVVPGNHDIYARDSLPDTDGPAAVARTPWPAFATSDHIATGAPPPDIDAAPFRRQRGSLVLIGVSSAVPTAPLLASGAVDDHQLAGLAHHLADDALAGQFRVLLIHHSPRAGDHPRRKQLRRAGLFRRVLANARFPVHLILHGHGHVAATGMFQPGPAASRCTIVAAPAASAAHQGARRAGGYHQFEIEQHDGWQVKLQRRAWAEGWRTADAQTWHFPNDR